MTKMKVKRSAFQNANAALLLGGGGGAGMRLRGGRPKSDFQRGCKSGYWRLEKWLSGKCWRLHNRWSAVGSKKKRQLGG